MMPILLRSRRTTFFSAAVFSAALLLLSSAGCKRPSAATAEAPRPSDGAARAADAPTPVRVTSAENRTLTRTVEVTGSIQALQSVTLSAEVAGKVLQVAGREGSPVRKGQIVAQQETAGYRQQVNQAKANLQAAQVRLQQAQTNLRLQKSTNSTSVAGAEAQLRAARAALELARNPQRSQEVSVAENNVAQAQAQYDKARKDRERYDQLVKEGAAAQATLDQYVASERVAKAALDSSQELLDIARSGGRAAQVRQSEAQVRQSEENLRQARAGTQQADVRRDDIAAAQAVIAQQRALLRQAELQLAQASIVSPINGVISARLTEPGQIAAPGVGILRLVALDTVYYSGKVPETELAGIQVGQSVLVRVDAIPGKVFTGKAARLEPTGNAEGRTFNLRINIPNSGRALRPGMFARGSVITGKKEATVVPQIAVLRGSGNSGGAAYDGNSNPARPQARLFVVKNNVAQERTVRLGQTTPDGALIAVEGIAPGTTVVVSGQRGIKDGQRVNPEQSTARAAASASPENG